MLFFPDYSTVIWGAPRLVAGASRLVVGAPRLVAGAPRLDAGPSRCSQACHRRSQAYRQCSQSYHRCSQAYRQHSQAYCRRSQVLPGAPKVLSGAPRCYQIYHNHSDGTSVAVIREPSNSEGRPECPPRVWYSPEIDASQFTLHILSDTPGVIQWLKYILLMSMLHNCTKSSASDGAPIVLHDL